MDQILIKSELQRVFVEDLVEGEITEIGDIFYFQNGNPFTGFAVLEYGSSGMILFEVEYKDGLHIGWEIEYYETGEKKHAALSIGNSSILFYDFDKAGKIIGGGKKLTDESSYNKIIKKYDLNDKFV